MEYALSKVICYASRGIRYTKLIVDKRLKSVFVGTGVYSSTYKMFQNDSCDINK